MMLRNLLLILFLLSACTGSCVDKVEPEPPAVIPDRVIMICIDAWRYDHFTDEFTQNIKQFSDEYTSYTKAYTAGSWTKPSIAALFTGKWPYYAGVVGQYDSLPEEHTTFAEVFQENGWTTIGVSANLIVRKEKGYTQGFDVFHEPVNKPASEIITQAITSLNNHIDEPLFLYLHLMDPHMPLNPPQEFRERFKRGTGPYSQTFGEIGIEQQIVGEARRVVQSEIALQARPTKIRVHQ